MPLGDSGSSVAFAISSCQTLDSQVDLGVLFVSIVFLDILMHESFNSFYSKQNVGGATQKTQTQSRAL